MGDSKQEGFLPHTVQSYILPPFHNHTCRFVFSRYITHYRKRSLRREEYSLVRTKPWALGEELFAESKKKSRRRKKLSVKVFFAESFFLALGEVIFKKSFFTFKLFLSSTCTYTKDMFKFDAILSLFAIFKSFNSFYVIFSSRSDMNYKCMKS
jgi:hypothetical protein